MRLKDILFLGRGYIILGIVLLVFLSVIFLIGYFLVYKLIMKGKKKPSKKMELLSMVTLLYAMVVLGAVFFNRVSSSSGAKILYPFYSYRDAWNSWSTYAWRGIVLNVAMFIPLGALLPLWSKRLQSFLKVLIIGFIATLFIEAVQYIFKIGVFEVDDLINNTLGALIGYGIMMVILALVNRRRLGAGSVLLYLSPALLVAVAFGIIITLYNSKELGNLSIAYSHPVDMRDTSILSEVDYTSSGGQAMVYRVPNIIVSEAEVVAEEFFLNLGTRVNKAEKIIYDETAIFYSEDREYSLWVNYRGGTYSFSGFNYSDEDRKISADAKEEDIRRALSSMNVNIPKEARFYYDKEKESFVFKVDLVEENGVIYDGMLWCNYNNDGTINRINNEILELKPYKEMDIISEEEAYSEIKDGMFNWWGSDNDAHKTLTIKAVSLEYLLDSKGFYQPVYVFDAEAGGNELEINIPAVK